MIGADGRVRVMDFGLACATADAAPLMPPGRLHRLDWPKRVGEGTPGYMAPEQYLGIAQDVRCDVFSFCVVLFEALYGRRPFRAGGPVGAPGAIRGGATVATPDRGVPGWLDAVIRRGLLRDVRLRWASINELLAALAHPPPSLLRRLLRPLGAFWHVGVIAMLAALGTAVFIAVGALQRAEAERLADDRLAAAEAIIDRAEAEGALERAEATFQAFITTPAHRGTRALARAWQLHGDRRRKAGAVDAALDDYARAYLEVRAPADAAAMMHTMASMFHARWDGPALAQALATLHARGLATPADAALALDAALLQGDLGTAAALAQDQPDAGGWAPLLATLAQARPTDRVAARITALPAGGPAMLVALDVGEQEVVLLDRELAPLHRMAAAGRRLGLVDGAAWVHAFADGQTALFDLADQDRVLWRAPTADPIHRGRALDLDGDGAPELLFGRRWPSLGFRVLTGLGGPAREQVAHAASDVSESELSALWAGDLDGDGAQEVVAAFGAWSAFDLRVFRPGDDGALELLARRRFGRITALTGLRRGAERLLVAINDEHSPSPALFPAAPHTGEPAGVHLLRWDGAALAEVDFLPLPRNEAREVQSGSVALAADLDGDAVEELVLDLAPPGITLLVRPLATGLEARRIHGMRPLAAAQLDDDPAQELLVRANHDDATWILGIGDTPLPRLGPAPASSSPVPPSLNDPLLIDRWVRADELAGVGLLKPAAASLREVVALTDDPQARHDLRDRAAELLVRAGDDAGAMALGDSADPLPGSAALLRSAAALARLGRYEEAHSAALAVLADPQRAPAMASEAAALRERLDPLVGPGARLDLDFGAPLDPAWALDRPASLRRDLGRGGLQVTLAADPLPVASLPLAWDGGPLALEYELDLERLEYGACLRLAVLDRDDRPWIGAGVCGAAGGRRLLHIDRCLLGGSGWIEFDEQPIPSAVAPRHLVLRVAAFPDGSAECSVDDGVQVRRAARPGASLPLPGPLRLAIGTLTDNIEPTLAIGNLRRITVHGARMAAAPDPRPQPDLAARLLVEGEPLAALEALDEVVVSDPRDALLRVLAYHDLRDLPGLERATAELLPHLGDPAWRADLALLLRTQPAAAMALLEIGGAQLLPALAFTWVPLRTHLHDPDIAPRVLAELGVLDQLRPTSDPERRAMRRLLALRGAMHEQVGALTDARGDLEAALAVPAVASPEDIEARVEVHLLLAHLLTRIDPWAVRAHADAALAITARPELVRDRLAALSGPG